MICACRWPTSWRASNRSEIIVNDRAALAACVPERAERAGTPDAETFEYPHAAKCLKEHFGKSIAELGLEDERLCVCAAGALLAYLTETQKNALTHILELRPYDALAASWRWTAPPCKAWN